MGTMYILDGKPVEGFLDDDLKAHPELPKNARFVGMEKSPNTEPRYGKLAHPWFNYACFETPAFTRSRNEDC